jgi:hypothetical protein
MRDNLEDRLTVRTFIAHARMGGYAVPVEVQRSVLSTDRRPAPRSPLAAAPRLPRRGSPTPRARGAAAPCLKSRRV